VLKRLERAGLAERLEKGRYELSAELTKKHLKAARKVRKPVLS
jgi:DNA-binding IclR family transcriptional regulator